MKNYLKIILDKVLQIPSPEIVLLEKNEFEDETEELIALMDIIPNAKSIAEMYQGLIKAGQLDPHYAKEDPTVAWLEIEEIVVNRSATSRYYSRKIIFTIILFIVVGIASYVVGSYLLSKEANQLNVQPKHV
ncbi:hypothetical protein CLV51_103389 [Chitinophaga niastensis]|uniref:Uncharacterized protein n=1 Tax=Chitinophaga niastensis TaxID=536980 RepID=A0A2P8HJM2_CHINA|nr:hypothetical protein [Chitinophaga niastensis]PSL46411.1 hypothetical protein CLV51_103389 [Chitinophaga niastensis]